MPDPKPSVRPNLADVTAVIVAHESAEVIADCVRPLAGLGRVILVDNASRDGTVAAARDALPTIEAIANAANVGYGAGNNIGAERASTRYLLLLTPDVAMTPGDIERLVAAAEASPDAAVVAPLLRGDDGRAELYVMGPHERRHRRLDEVPAGDFCTWFVMGAATLWRTKAWRALAGYDPAIFLYGEDTDLSLRCAAGGFAMIVAPGIVARHLGGRSSRPSWRVRWRRDWHMAWSHYYVETKHGSDRRAVRREAVRTLCRHGARALLYALLARPRRAAGNLARANAAWAFLRGRPSR